MIGCLIVIINITVNNNQTQTPKTAEKKWKDINNILMVILFVWATTIVSGLEKFMSG